MQIEREDLNEAVSRQIIAVEQAHALWKHFDDQTASWRRIWTTNGVSDTALFFRP